MPKKINVVGVASGIAAQDQGCADGPKVLIQSDFIKQLSQRGIELDWHDILQTPASYQADKPVMPVVCEICEQLAQITAKYAQQRIPFLSIGGDHAYAVGTWSGVYAGKTATKPLGLLWIDAHMDSHTPETTETGAIHGMPLAALLGHGDPQLRSIASSQAKILPENVVLVGVRSFEKGEAKLLEDLNVRVYFMDEINQRGIDAVLAEAFAIVSKNTAGYGISLDLDAIDPNEAPGVGSPVAGGIHGDALCQALAKYRNDKQRYGVGIVEFNPHRDHDQKTEKLVADLIAAMF